MKRFLLYIVFVLAAFSAAAQQPGNPKREEKIKALYVAYITQQLNLTPDEAQKFWPLHAQYENELEAINTGTTDELARQQAVLNVKKKYQPGFSKIVGADRVNNFYRQDAEFRKKLVERLNEIRQQRKGNVKAGGGMKRQNMLDN
jgi:Skp family chaperone for outer membrane proteins